MNLSDPSNAGHIQALREAFGSDLEVEAGAGVAPLAAEPPRPAPAPPPARPGAWQPSIPFDDRPGQVTFDAQHICGDVHRITGWTTSASGVVVFRDGPPNTPCGQAS